jgi:hypothetical protein
MGRGGGLSNDPPTHLPVHRTPRRPRRDGRVEALPAVPGWGVVALREASGHGENFRRTSEELVAKMKEANSK